jgi:hypothetical protein
LSSEVKVERDPEVSEGRLLPVVAEDYLCGYRLWGPCGAAEEEWAGVRLLLAVVEDLKYLYLGGGELKAKDCCERG